MKRGEAPLLGDALVAASGRPAQDQLVGLAVLALAEAIHRLADVQEQAATVQRSCGSTPGDR